MYGRRYLRPFKLLIGNESFPDHLTFNNLFAAFETNMSSKFTLIALSTLKLAEI